MSTTSAAEPARLLNALTFLDPYANFKRLREEDPVHRVEQFDVWFLSRYADITAVLLDDEHFSKQQTRAQLSLHPTVQKWLGPLFKDDPEHRRLRAPLEKLFTPRSVQRLESQLHQIVAAATLGLRGAGEVDLVRDFAYDIPLRLLPVLLGLPHEDFGLFAQWAPGVMDGFNPDPTSKAWSNGALAYEAVADYLRMQVRALRMHRGEEPTVLSVLVEAAEAGLLSEDELIGQAVLIFVGSHETTLNLISLAAYCLLRHPHEMERARRDPALIASAIEETLRYDGPGHLCDRRVCADVEIRGRTLREGDNVWLGLASGNRDPEVFDRPDDFILGRPNAARHIGFSHGIHLCLGRALARIEARIAIAALLAEFPRLELAEAPPLPYNENLFVHGLQRLPARLGR